jgi:hypothetical protein
VKKFANLIGILVIVALFQSFSLSAQAADPVAVGSVGIRISEIPADVADHPYAKVYIVSRLQPGVEMKQRLEVFNTSPKEFKVSLYPGMATFVKGEFKIGEGRMGNTLSRWTKLTPNTVLVKAGGSKFFNVTISPPSDAASITQYGVIWAEVEGTPNEAGITSVSRVGIRMYMPVGDSSESPISSTDMVSTTNEIVVKKSFISNSLLIMIGLFALLSLLFFIFFVVFSRRNNSVRKAQKKNEKQLEEQWRNELARRRRIWKHGFDRLDPRHRMQRPDAREQRRQPEQRDPRDHGRSYDEYDDEGR